MAEVTFIFNQTPTKIQCKKNETFSTIISRYASKSNINTKDLCFLCNGQQINPSSTYDMISKESEITCLVISVNSQENFQEERIKFSKDVICPKCGEICLFKIKDYDITLTGCTKGHSTTYKMVNYKDSQLIDESKITCSGNKSHNKAEVFENNFYRCIQCKKNLCPLCKNSHTKDHDIIDYNLINYTCLKHNEKFCSFCQKCKINLCIECESEHKDKENLLDFRDLLPNKEKFKNNLDSFKSKINEYKEKINEIKKLLDNFVLNLELYYNIGDNLFKNYEKKKRNYQSLKNISEIEGYNTLLIGDLNKILKNNDIINLLNNSYDIINKMGVQFNKNIISFNKMDNSKANDNNNIMQESKNKMPLNSSNDVNISKLYENCVNIHRMDDNYEKLVYIAMLSEQCKLFDDMIYFMKHMILRKKYILSSDERNLFSIACKNYVLDYRSAMRTIEAYEAKEKKKEYSSFLPYIKEYENIVGNIFLNRCNDIIKFINDNIIKKDFFKNSDNETKTFFFKMIGDYYRFPSETELFKGKYSKEVEKYFNEGLNFANSLPIYNPVKLGLYLNYSVFYYEIKENKKGAINLIKPIVEKFDKEAKNLDLEDDNVKDAISIYELMKENLDLWKIEYE